MTDNEREIIDLLVETWNKFLELPVEHPDQVTEFRYGIHNLQNQVGSRAVWRTISGK